MSHSVNDNFIASEKLYLALNKMKIYTFRYDTLYDLNQGTRNKVLV